MAEQLASIRTRDFELSKSNQTNQIPLDAALRTSFIFDDEIAYAVPPTIERAIEEVKELNFNRGH